MSTRELEAIVVAYGEPELLDRCLASVPAARRVTVVDNSASAAVRAVSQRHGAIYVDAGGNRGFAAAVNTGLRRHLSESPSDVLLLNPDVALGDGTIETLAAFLHRRENRDVAAVSPRLVDPDGAEQRVVWPLPTPARAWLDAVGIGRLPATRTFVVGTVLLLRWEALHEIGLFDERFFLYAEETDWQRRAHAAGWRSALCERATAVHVGAATSSSASRRAALFHAAQETYVRKWYGGAGWLAYRAAALCGSAARAAVLPGDRRGEAALRVSLYLRGPRRVAAVGGD